MKKIKKICIDIFNNKMVLLACIYGFKIIYHGDTLSSDLL